MELAMGPTTARVATEADLLRTPRDGQKYELVDGEIRVSPAGTRHGQVCVNLILLLGAFVKRRRLGLVFDSSTGFRMPSRNVRSPDISFVARGRLRGKIPDSFSDVVPDLAVEVLSPADSNRQILDRVGEFLQAGVRMVWIVDPRRSRAAVYRTLTDVEQVDRDGWIDGGQVVRGFRCRLSDVLA
jgi:Uma2 family endonuclease